MKSRALALLSTLSLSILALGAAGCANGHSPTEPAFDDGPLAAQSLAATGDKRRGGGDTAGDSRRGRGNDDRRGDNRRGRGNDRRRAPGAGAEFAGTVTAVDGGTIRLAGGGRVAVDGRTQWSARGDLFSLADVAASLAAGDPTRVEGRGVRQADGSILAQTLEAEVDD